MHKLMAEAQLQGLPVRKGRKNLVNAATAEDLVCRDFAREAPNELWLTDITEHPTSEGKVYCCVVLDAHSRKVVGWSIDSHQASSLVTNALSMAIEQPRPSQRRGHPLATTAASSAPGRSANTSARPASSPRWEPSATRTTTP